MAPRSSKKMMKRAKRALAKQKKARARKNADTFFLRTKVLAALTPEQGAKTSNYIAQFWKLLDSGSTVGVTQSSEFTLFKNIYDRVRINRITVKVVPKANVLSFDQAQNDSNFNLNGDGKCHTVVLRDDDGYSASVPRLQRQPSYRGYNVLRSWSRTYSIKYPTDVWLDCQDIYSDMTLIERLGGNGGIGMFAANFLEDNNEVINEPWASVEITYDCVFQGKICGSLSLTETGAVAVAPPVSNIVSFTPMRLISGTFNDTAYDLSGNEVFVNDDSTP